MEITIEHISELSKKLTITLPQELVASELAKVYTKYNKEVDLKGFRKGKIPQSVLEKHFKSAAQEDAGAKLVEISYFDAIEQEKLDPVVHPEITKHTFHEDGRFSYEALVDVQPTIGEITYKGLEIEKKPVVVTDEDVEETLKLMQRMRAALQSVPEDQVIALDNLVTIDCQAFEDGKPMKKVKMEDARVDVGRAYWGKEFDDNLIGKKKGEQTLFEMTFPDNHVHPLLAGKTVEFKVDVKDVQERILTDMDDEFAKDVNASLNTLDELRDEIRGNILRDREAELQGKLDDAIMSELIVKNPLEVPDRLVDYEVQEMLKQLDERLQRQGSSLEATDMDMEKMGAEYREIATKRVQGDFLLKKIAEEEEIKVADEDIQKGYQRIASEYRMSVDEVKKFFQRREEILPFVHELLNEKVLAFLRENAKYVASKEDAPAAE